MTKFTKYNLVAENPQYTKPADFKGSKVPEVLLSGDHGKIVEWRRVRRMNGTLSMKHGAPATVVMCSMFHKRIFGLHTLVSAVNY